MDKKGFFGGGYIFWCFAAGILAVAGMALAAGRKEISLREEFYGKLLAEQTAAGEDRRKMKRQAERKLLL